MTNTSMTLCAGKFSVLSSYKQMTMQKPYGNGTDQYINTGMHVAQNTEMQMSKTYHQKRITRSFANTIDIPIAIISINQCNSSNPSKPY